jgi:NADH-quinone oxidoreductase subunit C
VPDPLSAAAVLDRLRATLAADLFEAAEAADQAAVFVPRERLVEICQTLRDHPELRFAFLAELTAVDWWPREPRFEIVYHLASLGTDPAGATGPADERSTAVPPPMRLRVKLRVPGNDARVPCVSAIWPAAGWLEREVWDLFGIVFDGHADLRRLLMPEDWEGHPLRKDHPVQIALPPKTYEPLQVTEEQFIANITAARQATKPS